MPGRMLMGFKTETGVNNKNLLNQYDILIQKFLDEYKKVCYN